MATPTVFLSFSKEDAGTQKHLGRELASCGLRVRSSADQSQTGPRWSNVVGEAIAACGPVLVLWSRHAAQSHFVEFEYTKAIALRKKIVLCLLDDTPLPGPLAACTAIGFSDPTAGTSRLLGEFALSGPESTQGMSGRSSGPPESRTPSSPDAGDAGTILAGSGTQELSARETAGMGDTPGRAWTQEPPPPQLGDRYSIIRMLGRGGMGAVYHAHDSELERDVALKVIRAELAEDPPLLKRFKREIQLSSTVTHRNVLRVYDLGESTGVKFLTMQYVDGEDLGSLLKREGRLPVARLLHIFRQVCNGLAAAHEQGVLHRDLKPANIMIDREDNVYLTDFGLARSVAQSGLTQAGDVMGTPHYMSPEQVKGETADMRSDIYSLGVILYEMVTGQVPYRGDTIYEVMIQRVQKAPRPAVELNPELPAFLDGVIRRSMAIEKVARYSSVQELLSDLSQGAGTGRTLVASRFYLRRWRGLIALLRWRRMALAVAAVAVLILGGWWLWQQGLNTARAPAAAPKPVSVLIADLENRTGDPLLDGTLEPALETTLEGASFVTTFDRNQARRIAGRLKEGAESLDQSLARLVAMREGINVIVAGSISASDRGYEISLSAIDALTGEEMASSSASAPTREEVLESVGKLSARIRTTLGDTTPESAQLVAAETFTSSSLEAAQAYASAQRLQGAGQWEEAIAAYNRVIEMDPGLGRAYAGLAVAYRNLGRRDEAEKQYQLALTNIDRMTDREKYKTRGGYFLVIGNYAKAIEELTRLIEHFPADFAGHTNLALAYFYTRNMGAAQEAARRATEIYPGNIVMRSNLALFALYASDFKTAAEMAREIIQTEPSRWRVYVCLALAEIAQGRPEAAVEAYSRLEGLGLSAASIGAMGLADLALFQGRLDDAAEILRKGIAADEANKDAAGVIRKSAALAQALAGLGSKSEALAQAERIVTGGQPPPVLFEAARVFIAVDRPENALRIAAELEKSLRQEPRMYGKLIEGEVRLSRREVWDAVRLFHEAQELNDTWLGRYNLGRAYLDGSAFTEAYSE
ncbi:MAG: tetratricopeptide repeat protein, partial [Acidobacteria bacterium]|nr:tetratricopeptide repeat protein [Acidobacteriota bacterium]